MSIEMRKYINLFNESVNEHTIQIRSTVNKNFRFDITYDQNNKIIKTEIQGGIQNKLSDQNWLNLIINFNVKQILNYDQLRNILAKIPELFVKDIL